MAFLPNIKVEHPERKSDIPDKKTNKSELNKPTEKKDKIKENREKEKKKEPEREKREVTKEKQKTQEINREQEEQKKVKEKESKKSEEIKEKKSKNIDTKKKQDISSEKNIISEPKKERDRKIEKKKVSKDDLEKHKEPKDITNDLNDLKRQRNENSNLIDFCKKKLKEGNFDGIITREGHEQKLKELIKKNEQMEKQLREFNNNSSHSEIINNEKLKDKRREVILEKRNTELKQKQKNENLKEEEQISREKAKELGRNLPNRGKQKQEKQKEIPEEKRRYIELDREKNKSEEKTKKELSSEKQKLERKEFFLTSKEKKELLEEGKAQATIKEGENTENKSKRRAEESIIGVNGLREKIYESKREEYLSDFRNLMDSELQRYFKEYFDKIGKGANRGLRITNVLKDFLENHEKVPNKVKEELLDKISKINENGEIENFIINQIKFSNLSQYKIKKILTEMGLVICRNTIRKVSLENVYNGDLEKHNERFSVNPHERISDEKRKAIIEAGTAKEHGSLNNLSEQYKVALGSVKKILMKEKGEDWVKEEYPTPERISDEKRKDIIRDGTAKDHGSLNKLAKKHEVDFDTVKKLLIKEKGEDWVKEDYPFPERISDEKRKAIMEAGTAKDHGSLNDLGEKFEVAHHSVRKILVKEKGEDWVKEEYPAPERVSAKKRKAIIEAGTAEKHASINMLAEEFEIAEGSVRKILVEAKGEDWVKDEFPQDLPIEKGRLTHNLVKSHITKVFDERRKNSPEVPEMISEPLIYSGSSKSADIGFKNIPNYLQKLLIKNDLFQRLNIEPKSIEHIRFVQFDFTNAIIKKNIINKAIKYQHYKVITFVVGTSWRQKKSPTNIPNDKAIMYPENIRVISYDLFVDLLDLRGEERDEFIEIIKLNEGNEIEILRRKWKNNNQKLHYSGKEIKEFLENNTRLDFWMG